VGFVIFLVSSIVLSNIDGVLNMDDSNSSSSSSDKKMFQKTYKQHQIMFAHAIVGANSFELFDANNLKSSVGQLVNQDVCVLDVFATMWATPCLFKTITNFNLLKFDELTTLVIPAIVAHARFINEAYIVTS
jgi:hypothetical protein